MFECLRLFDRSSPLMTNKSNLENQWDKVKKLFCIQCRFVNKKFVKKKKSQCRGGSLAVAAAATATSTAAGTRRRGRTTATTAAPVFPTKKELHEN